MSELIRLQGISKKFGSVHALKSVDLALRAGEILALVGENGAGKSTLMKILGGLYPHGDYDGIILSGEKTLEFHSALDSEKSGIAFIHQELSSFPHLSVAENMMVGHWPNRLGWLSSDKIYEQSEIWLNKLGADFSCHEKMSSLSAGQQQVVEIAKALSRKSKILILDEPTSSLSRRETENLFTLLKNLRSQGCGLIYISHRMEEIFSLADRVAVLRDGQSVFTGDIAEVDQPILIHHMVGRPLNQLFPPPGNSIKEKNVLEVKNFKAVKKLGQIEFGPLSFSLRKGEVLGFGGLLGSGRSEILQALCGDDSFESSGSVVVEGRGQTYSHLREAYHCGFGLVPEDRKNQSILPSRSLTENAGILRLSQNAQYQWVSEREEDKRTILDLKILNTKFNSVAQRITELSGGNQQKIIFARVLQNNPGILILDEPTRGIDVGAKFEIYQLMRQWTAEGKSILLISSDMPELMAMSDRILVMGQRKIRGELQKSEFEQETIMQMALQID